MDAMSHSTTTPAERLLRLIHWSSAASRGLRRQLAEVAGSLGLSDNELLVVWLCRGTDRVQVELATSLGVSPAQMSGIVERLGAQRLLEMHRHTADRRRQIWRTSAAGQALLQQAAARLEELAAALEIRLPPGEFHAAQPLCRRVAEACSPQPDSAVKTSGQTGHQRHDGQQEAAA
jgi:DNA-binding MarR family transcriptional regulator